MIEARRKWLMFLRLWIIDPTYYFGIKIQLGCSFAWKEALPKGSLLSFFCLSLLFLSQNRRTIMQMTRAKVACRNRDKKCRSFTLRVSLKIGIEDTKLFAWHRRPIFGRSFAEWRLNWWYCHSFCVDCWQTKYACLNLLSHPFENYFAKQRVRQKRRILHLSW